MSPITVAISGCSSSGKTTLALILADIFGAHPANIQSKEGEVSGDTNSKRGRDGDAILIHQDDYFLTKPECPVVTFTSTAADVLFLEKTLEKNELEEYSICAWTAGVNTNRDESINMSNFRGVANGAKNSAVSKVHGLQPIWKVTGPDSDCWDAVDIAGIVDTLEGFKVTGALSATASNRHGKSHLTCSPRERQVLRTKYKDLITAMRDKVQTSLDNHVNRSMISRLQRFQINSAVESHMVEEQARPTFCFIEGFLLFLNPNTNTNTNNIPAASSNLVHPDNQHMNDGDIVKPNNFQQHASSLALAHERKAASKEKLMSLFDIKLFLPISKQEAKKRRFERDCYIDGPCGGRVAGQMWKTDGYFEEVVWGNYERECGWILDGEGPGAGAEEMGVRVRAGREVGVEETVVWAVETILGELRRGRRVGVGKLRGGMVRRGLRGWLVDCGTLLRDGIKGLRVRVAGLFVGKREGNMTETDVGLQTVLGSGVIVQGLWSPKF